MERPHLDGGAAPSSTDEDEHPQPTPLLNDEGDHYARIPAWLLEAAVSGNAVKLYGLLDRRCQDEDRPDCPKHCAFPSRTTLAAQMRCSRETVDRAVRELVEVGAVRVTKRWDAAGDPTTNLYEVVARTRLRSRKDASTQGQGCDHGGHKDAATGSRVDDEQNQSNPELEQRSESTESLAGDLVLRGQVEVPKVVRALITAHGQEMVSNIVRAMFRNGTQFFWPSEFRSAVEDEVAKATPRYRPSTSVEHEELEDGSVRLVATR